MDRAESISASKERGATIFGVAVLICDGIIADIIYCMLAVLEHASARVQFPESTSFIFLLSLNKPSN